MENMTTSLNDEVLVLEVSSEDEARAQAAACWGIPADEVVLNVIEEGKSFLGLFGRKLKIEARRPAAFAPAAAADADAEPESSSDFMTLLKKVIDAAGLELDAAVQSDGTVNLSGPDSRYLLAGRNPRLRHGVYYLPAHVPFRRLQVAPRNSEVYG